MNISVALPTRAKVVHTSSDSIALFIIVTQMQINSHSHHLMECPGTQRGPVEMLLKALRLHLVKLAERTCT